VGYNVRFLSYVPCVDPKSVYSRSTFIEYINYELFDFLKIDVLSLLFRFE